MLQIEEIQTTASAVGAPLTENQAAQFVRYAELLIEWNARINLTAITEPRDILTRHFADSLTALQVIPPASHLRLLDLGSGAGLPGIALKIARGELDVMLMDSVGKKMQFCETVIAALGLNGIRAVHARAEEVAHQANYREQFDIVIARAVAPLNTLVEYLLPFARVGAQVIAMKGSDAVAELEQARSAIKLLGGEVERVVETHLPNAPDKRTLISIRKISATKKLYPRQSGAPRNKPL